MVLEKPISAHKLLLSNMSTISRLDLTAWSPTLCNEFKRLLRWKSKSKMVNAKVRLNKSTGEVACSEADDPSQHSRIVASAGIHKNAFRPLVIVISEIPLLS